MSAGTSINSGFVGPIPWGPGEPRAIITNGDCATINASQKTWVIQDCTIVDMAICEDTIIICPGQTVNDGANNCACPGDTVNDGSDNCIKISK